MNFVVNVTCKNLKCIAVQSPRNLVGLFKSILCKPMSHLLRTYVDRDREKEKKRKRDHPKSEVGALYPGLSTLVSKM